MEMHQVRYFLAVARTLNFTRAADECNVTQPSLTRAIQKLEDEFGGLLFRRERSLTHLTDLGREMLPHLQRTFDAAQAAKLLAKRIGKAQVAPLSLGVADTLHAPQLGAVLAEVASSLVGFELSVASGSSAALLEAAMRGELDIVIVEQPDDPPERLDHWELYSQDYVVVARADHRFAVAGDLILADLAGERWIEREQDTRFRALCESGGVEPDYAHRAAGDMQIQRLVAAGLGCALLPGDAPFDAALVTRSIKDANLSRPVVLGTIGGRQRSAAVDAFVRAARARSWPA